MQKNSQKVQEIYEYLSQQDQLEPADGVFVFGRADHLLAHVAAEIIHQNYAKYIMFTGGVGKDSKYLTELTMTEADFLAAYANVVCKISGLNIYRENKATNGGENAKLGLQTILDNNLPCSKLIIVAHATSLRRLTATLEQEIINRGLRIKLIKASTPYVFDANNPADSKEATDELTKLVSYAEKGWCKPQSDLPQHLLNISDELLK